MLLNSNVACDYCYICPHLTITSLHISLFLAYLLFLSTPLSSYANLQQISFNSHCHEILCSYESKLSSKILHNFLLLFYSKLISCDPDTHLHLPSF